MPTALFIRELRAPERSRAFTVVHQLRGHLDLETFERRVAHQSAHGYVLHGAFDGQGNLLGVMGMRPVTTLARGVHLHVDDLVVDRNVRGTGIGASLLAFAERWAAENDCDAVFLDSRPEVVAFYAGQGYAPHTSTQMRKPVAGLGSRGVG